MWPSVFIIHLEILQESGCRSHRFQVKKQLSEAQEAASEAGGNGKPTVAIRVFGPNGRCSLPMRADRFLYTLIKANVSIQFNSCRVTLLVRKHLFGG